MAAAATTEREIQLVAFRIASETYGIPIELVQEIIRMCEITEVPRSSPFVRGVVNLRGRIVPVVDMRKRLGMAALEDESNSRIVVLEIEDGVVGMLVDSVSEVLKIGENTIEFSADLVGDIDSELFRGVGKHGEDLIVLLDFAKAFGANQMGDP